MFKYHGNFYYTASEVAEQIYVHPATVRKYCIDGKIKAKKRYDKDTNQLQWAITETALTEYKKKYKIT